MPDVTWMSATARSILAMLVWSPYYIVPTTVFCLGARLIRSRPRPPLTLEDWLLFVVPWFVWFSAMMINGNHKTLANFAEAYGLIFLAVVCFIARLRFGQRYGPHRVGLIALAVVCLAGLALAFLVPPLPE